MVFTPVDSNVNDAVPFTVAAPTPSMEIVGPLIVTPAASRVILDAPYVNAILDNPTLTDANPYNEDTVVSPATFIAIVPLYAAPPIRSIPPSKVVSPISPL